MRNPENVLNSLQEHSAQSGYVYDRLYRNLFNREFFLQAYQNIYASQGNMTAGTDGKTIDAMSLERVDRLIAALKDESYQPKPSRRTYIPKKNGKLRPLGIPSIDDKLVQEVVRMLLESIYENSFEDTSHGFRPNKSCHTALRMIQNRFTRCKWFVEGDIKGFFDNIDHNVMIGILRKRIKDERFLRLIRKFLNAGYMEDNQVHQSYSGTPQGGIISPILANIYLDQFDKYMAEFKKRFDRGNKRAVNVEYRKLSDMTEAGFTGFERGVLGSTAENLSSLDYQIQKDKERLAHIQERIEAEQVRYVPAHEVRKTMVEIEGMGQKTITGKIAVSKDDYQQLTALAKEGITSRSEIQNLKSSVSYYQRQYFNASSAVERLQERYDRLKEKCQPFLQALEHFPKLVEVFVEKVKELFSIKEAQERKEREDRAAARKEQSKHRRGRNDWER